MKTSLHSEVARLTNDELIAQVIDFARHEREATANLIARLAELDTRKLYLDYGCASLHAYCVETLRLADFAAYKRIAAARVVQRYPHVLDLLASGALNTSTIGVLAPLLESPDFAEILAAAEFKSKRQVEKLVADFRPLPDVPTIIRRVSTAVSTAATSAATEVNDPVSTNGSGTAISIGTDLPLLAEPAGSEPSEVSTSSSGPAAPSQVAIPASQRPVIAPLGNDRYKIQVMVSAETHDKVLRAQALLRHAIPTGDLAAVIDRAFTLLLKNLEKTRLAATDKPRASRMSEALQEDEATSPSPTKAVDGRGHASRHIPADLVRQVFERDGYRCTKTGKDGRRCTRTDRLEIDHVKPWAVGGETRLENLRLFCWAHNRHAAEQYYGVENVKRKVKQAETQRKAARRVEASKSRGTTDRAPRGEPRRATPNSDARVTGRDGPRDTTDGTLRESPAVYWIPNQLGGRGGSESHRRPWRLEHGPGAPDG